MLKPGQIIRKLLTDNAAVDAIVEGRVYPATATVSRGQPYVIYQTIDTEHQNDMGGASGLANAMMQVESFSTSYQSAIDLAYLCRDALHAHSGTVTVGNDTSQVTVWLNRTLDDPGQPEAANDTKIYRVIQEYSVWHEETQLRL